MPFGLSDPFAHAWQDMYKGIDDQGPYYRCSYYFNNWADSDSIANQLRGWTSRTGTSTVRVGPHRHPLSNNLVCMSVEIEGLGNAVLNANGFPSYDGGFFAHTTYRAPPWLPYADDDVGNVNAYDPGTVILWCTQEMDFDHEYDYLETNKFKWSSGPNSGKPTDVPVPVFTGVGNITLTYHQLPWLPSALIRGLRNKVNNSSFLGVASGLIHFKGGRSTTDRNTDGSKSTRLTLFFRERDVDWNKIRGKDGSWQSVQDGGGNPIYASADLSPLVML